jgi:hypothetical protein
MLERISLMESRVTDKARFGPYKQVHDAGAELPECPTTEVAGLLLLTAVQTSTLVASGGYSATVRP